jgi:hypothetical protein
MCGCEHRTSNHTLACAHVCTGGPLQSFRYTSTCIFLGRGAPVTGCAKTLQIWRNAWLRLQWTRLRHCDAILAGLRRGSLMQMPRQDAQRLLAILTMIGDCLRTSRHDTASRYRHLHSRIMQRQDAKHNSGHMQQRTPVGGRCCSRDACQHRARTCTACSIADHAARAMAACMHSSDTTTGSTDGADSCSASPFAGM